MKPLRVLLADDHGLVRAGIRALLQSLPGIDVVAEADTGQRALDLIQQHHPDIVLMDVAMPGLNGLQATAKVSELSPQTRVVILSMYSDEEYVSQALRAGAAGYLLKDAGAAELELALTAVARGETYLSPAVSKHLVAHYVRPPTPPPTQVLLTPRKREILQLIALGHSTKEIARLLHLSVKTVETHRMQLMERLDIHDIAGLVRYAIRTGLINPE